MNVVAYFIIYENAGARNISARLTILSGVQLVHFQVTHVTWFEGSDMADVALARLWQYTLEDVAELIFSQSRNTSGCF